MCGPVRFREAGRKGGSERLAEGGTYGFLDALPAPGLLGIRSVQFRALVSDFCLV